MNYEQLNRLSKEELIRKVMSLESRRRLAWKSFYNLFDERHDEFETLRTNIQTAQTSEDISYIKRRLVELMDELNRFEGCPVCLETITKESVYIGNCGHMTCKDCHTEITQNRNKQCPICRKTGF